MAKKPLPSPEVLRQLLRYEPDTGKLFWRERGVEWFRGGKYSPDRVCRIWNKKYSGREAGSPNGHGYLRINIGAARFLSHRVIWAMMFGHWPADEIDHINGSRSDNKISNLREADRSQNGHNKGAPKSNVSGRKGVSWHKHGRKWQVKLGVNGQQYYLGLFSDFDQAVEVRAEAARRLAGEFSKEGA